MSDQNFAKSDGERTVEKTINAYETRKLEDGSVQIKSGGTVVTGETYFDALESYAQLEKDKIHESPEHLQEDKTTSIHDGVIPLYSFSSAGFTPEQVLDYVFGHPLDIILDDIGRYEKEA